MTWHDDDFHTPLLATWLYSDDVSENEIDKVMGMFIGLILTSPRK